MIRSSPTPTGPTAGLRSPSTPPWSATSRPHRHSLRLAQDYGVFKKILFGSDYPFTTVDESVEGLWRIAAVPGIPGLDPLDRDAVEAIIDRDSLALLQLS